MAQCEGDVRFVCVVYGDRNRLGLRKLGCTNETLLMDKYFGPSNSVGGETSYNVVKACQKALQLALNWFRFLEEGNTFEWVVIERKRQGWNEEFNVTFVDDFSYDEFIDAVTKLMAHLNLSKGDGEHKVVDEVWYVEECAGRSEEFEQMLQDVNTYVDTLTQSNKTN